MVLGGSWPPSGPSHLDFVGSPRPSASTFLKGGSIHMMYGIEILGLLNIDYRKCTQMHSLSKIEVCISIWEMPEDIKRWLSG